MEGYAIHGGDKGKRRLDILSRTIGPNTEKLLRTAGLGEGMNCLDLGCGGGNVTMQMATIVGPHGMAVGADIDKRMVRLAQDAANESGLRNTTFLSLDTNTLMEESKYDFVYARFLLSHLSDPRGVLDRMCRAVAPGGVVAIEDTDFSGHFCFPESDAFNSYVSLYQQLLQGRGADADIGQRLPGLMKSVGLVDVKFQVTQPAFLEGEGKLMAEITFDGISRALVDDGLISAPEAERIQRDLIRYRKNSNTLMSLARIFQARGSRRLFRNRGSYRTPAPE